MYNSLIFLYLSKEEINCGKVLQYTFTYSHVYLCVGSVQVQRSRDVGQDKYLIISKFSYPKLNSYLSKEKMVKLMSQEMFT